jgi:ubiquitin-conjugating enzyme E2 variant
MDRVTEKGPHRTPATSIGDMLAVATVTAGLAILAVRLWRAVDTPLEAMTVVVMLAAGYLTADLLTGFVHWFCDTFFEVTTPIIGPTLIAPFREHHRDPLLMTRHGFLELTGTSFRGMAPLLVAFIWLGSWPVALEAFVLAMASGAVGTNLLHRWAHDPAPPSAVRALQRVGLILTPERHARHHAPPYAAAYCVTSGWLNPLCDRIQLWKRAEFVIRFSLFFLPQRPQRLR